MKNILTREDLVVKMNLTGAPSDVQDQIIAQYGENVLKEATLEALSSLSDDDRKQLEKHIETGNEKDIEVFLAEKVTNFDQIIEEKSDALIQKIRKEMSE